MANTVAAPITGTVDTKVSAGASVTEGQVLAVQISTKVRDHNERQLHVRSFTNTLSALSISQQSSSAGDLCFFRQSIRSLRLHPVA